MEGSEAVASSDANKSSPAKDATNSAPGPEAPWYQGAALPLSLSFFLLVAIGSIYYRARRNRPRPSAGGSGVISAGSDGRGPPDTPTSAES